ncbi:MAG: formylglycine-generating enzyme family protein [Candidatus Sumerlaeia bacterium]|nr:formylglycine-generating enzyme family protein [Candidatus Sumerlaeia bacterium]
MTQPRRVNPLGLFALVLFAHLLGSPLGATPADELADRLVGIGSVEPADDQNADGVVDAADVVSTLLGVVELTITSTTPAGAVSAERFQTLTFRFDQPVQGFTDSDVSLAGATKVDFGGEGDLYWMLVEGIGGIFTAQVADSAVGPSSVGASFSNFYQDTWTLNLPGSVPLELIRIPAGTFRMGSANDERSRQLDELRHTVTISHDFYLGKTEVTQAQWLAICGSFPSGGQSHGTGAGSEARAVHLVSHDDIMNASTGFMKLLNDHVTEPGTLSLPTESQWEYAARARTTTRFSFGNGYSTDEYCSTGGGREINMWYCGNAGSSTQLVGQKPANAWGLWDMHGNLWEWCSDWYAAYPTGTVTDPVGPGSGTHRVRRGGGWGNISQYCRSAVRSYDPPSGRFDGIGFRVLGVRPSPPVITRAETALGH